MESKAEGRQRKADFMSKLDLDRKIWANNEGQLWAVGSNDMIRTSLSELFQFSAVALRKRRVVTLSLTNVEGGGGKRGQEARRRGG